MKQIFVPILILSVIISGIIGGLAGYVAGTGFGALQGTSILSGNQKVIQVEEESAVVGAVEKVSPAVVSIIITKDVPNRDRSVNPLDDFLRQFFGETPQSQDQQGQQETQKQEIGGGTGFLVSSDGYIVTNKHVVADVTADYMVFLNDGKSYPAKVLARDPLNDIAIIKIEGNNFPTLELGDSSNLKAGQKVIAIGNALGEFRNTVSTGVVSGLSRSIVASGTGFGSEQLFDVIQTDASINPGNSGGPLLNIAGQAIGMNTAIVLSAQNIGFAIPINEVRSAIESVQEQGRIIRPSL